LGQALAAYRQALLAYRRLARLAPDHFDTTVIERERRAREAQRRWHAHVEAALEKVYGPPTPAEREAQRLADLQAEQPPPLPPDLERRVETELANRQLWLATGRQAFAQYQRRYPHDRPRLGRIARMLDIACTFGRIATGMDTSVAVTAPPPPELPEEPPRRHACGDPPPAEPLTAIASNAVPAPVQPVVTPLAPAPEPIAPAPAETPPIAQPAVPPPPRRDAWSRFARHLRQSARTPRRF
jgi:hypothetical protein